MQDTLISITSGLFAGYGLSRIIVYLLPTQLKKGNKKQKFGTIEQAKEEAERLRVVTLEKDERKRALFLEEIEDDTREKLHALEERGEEIETEITEADEESKSLDKEQERLIPKIDKVERIKERYETKSGEVKDFKINLLTTLGAKADEDLPALKNSMARELISQTQLQTTKLNRILSDELENNIKRTSGRVLARLHARYTPDFIWPKGTNHVDVTQESAKAVLTGSESEGILESLSEITGGVQLKAEVLENRDGQPVVVRLGGGFGIHKEAMKRAIDMQLKQGKPFDVDGIQKHYIHINAKLENLALDLGKIAIQDLQLEPMHEEIMKLIGALNWRTSYRQNQYFHSTEVSRLAGLLASELQVDVNKAKRCGLLHDIGKAIDYRIEGSHAIISGDYADRYGESKEICDTVMSHHADLLVDTPLAYILMSADTLSGARPGARVNLEEGYRDRLNQIQDVIRSFKGVQKIEIMNGAREVHILVDRKKIKESELQDMSTTIARKIEEEVAFPGQIKILVTRRFEAVGVA